jgi:hypothetical protein
VGVAVRLAQTHGGALLGLKPCSTGLTARALPVVS